MGVLSSVLIILAVLSVMPFILPSDYFDIRIPVVLAFAGLSCAVIGVTIGITRKNNYNLDKKRLNIAGLILCIIILLFLALILLGLLAFSQGTGPILAP